MVHNDWIEWNRRQKRRGTVTSIGGAISLLASFCLAGLFAAIADRIGFSNQSWAWAFCCFGALFFGGLVAILAGVYVRQRAEIPDDIVEAVSGAPMPVSAPGNGTPGTHGTAIQSVFFMSPRFRVVILIVLLSLFSLLVFAKASFPFPMIVGILTVYCVLGIARVQCRTTIEIRPGDRTISFVDRWTRRIRTQSLQEFDGFVYYQFFAAGGKGGGETFYVLSLVQRGRRVQKISSDVYRNFRELKAGLNSMPQLTLTDTLPVGFPGRRT